MAREVRITIDDDEVFERMKARKQALDLSWEEVLHRGLRDTADEQADESAPPGTGAGSPERRGPGQGPEGPGTGPHGRGSNRRRHGGDTSESGRTDPGDGVHVEYDPFDPDDSIGQMVDEIKGQVQNQVRESLRSSMSSVEGPTFELDREMTELEHAEDAVLRFPDLAGDDPRYQVPLRVRLETSRGGMDIDVVAVREGKSVDGMNRFDSESRRAINEHLARNGTVTLSFENGAESYEVGPVLSWSRDDAGRPTVTDVTVTEVLFDDEP